MKRYRLYELKQKSAGVTEHDELKEAQAKAKEMKAYVIFDKNEKRIVEISKE